MLKRLLPWLPAAAAVTVLLVVSLPLLVERIVLPPLVAGTGYAGLRIDVSRFGLNGCTVHVAGRPEAAPPVVTGTVRIDWTVAGLLRGRVESVTGDSLFLHAGFPPDGEISPPRSRNSSAAASGWGGPPVSVERITVSNSFIIYTHDGGTLAVPVALTARRLEAQRSGSEQLHYRAALQIGRQEMDADFTYEHRDGRLTGRLAGEVNFPSLAVMLAPLFALPGQPEGRAAITLDYALRPVPFTLARLEGEMRLHGFRWNHPEAGVEISSREDARVTVAGGGSAYRIDLAGLALSGPVAAAVDAGADVFFDGSGAAWQGKMVISPVLGRQKGMAGELFIDEAVPMYLRHRGEIADGTVTGTLQSDPDAGQEGGHALRCREMRIRAAGLEAAGDFEFKSPGREDGLKAKVSLNGSGIDVQWPDGGFALPASAVRLSARFTPGGGEERPDLEGRLNIAVDELVLRSPDIRLRDILLDLPFANAGRPSPESGTFRINGILFRQVPLGGVAATVQHKPRELVLAGELRTAVLPEDPIFLTAGAGWPENGEPSGRLSWSVGDGRLDASRLADFHRALEGLSGAGMLDLSGNLAVGRSGTGGELTVSLRGGSFALPDAQIALRDAAFSLHFPSLPRPVSAPAQKISLGAVQGKKVVMNDVMITFQLESPESLFLEAVSARWSGGRIFTGGFRLRPGIQEVDAALICDRLELAEILSQLGLAEAEGDGRMSGRIPLRYADQAIFVDDGFLFTTPGEKGNLRIRRSEQLTLGLPGEGSRLSALHFAGAALGNFEYNWAKLYVVSEEENLLLQLQVDGRPRERLPYRYDPERNVFVRLQEGEKGGLDQPVRLDVNFRVPVNELFRYQSDVIPFLLRLK